MPSTKVFYVDDFHHASTQGNEVTRFVSDKYSGSGFAIVTPSEVTKEARVIFSHFGVQMIRIAYNVPNGRAVNFQKVIVDPLKAHLAKYACNVEVIDGNQRSLNPLSWHNHLLVTSEAEFPVSEVERFFEKF